VRIRFPVCSFPECKWYTLKMLSLTLCDINCKKAPNKRKAQDEANFTNDRSTMDLEGQGVFFEVCVCLYVCLFARLEERIGFPVCSFRFVPFLFLSRVQIPKPDIKCKKSGDKGNTDEKDGPARRSGQVCHLSPSSGPPTLTPLFIYST